MKTALITFITCLLTTFTFAQTDAQKIEDAKALITQKKYASAFETLSSSNDLSPELAITLAKLVTEHSLSVSKYQSWEMMDAGGSIKLFDLNVEGLLFGAIGKWPADCRLYEEQCRFYTFVLNNEGQYGSMALLTALNKSVDQYIQPKCPSYLSDYVLGYTSLELGQLDNAIEYLKKSIALNAGFAKAHLQLGRAYLKQKNMASALATSRKAAELAVANKERSGALLVAAQAYEAMNDKANALKNYLAADSLKHGDFFVLKSLLNFYVKTNNNKAAETVNAFLTSQDRGKLSYYLDVYDIYAANGRLADLAMIYQKRLADFKGTKSVEACLNFALGKIYQTTNADLSKQYLRTAKGMGLEAKNITDTRTHPNTSKIVTEAYTAI
ncbi:tetratricopeptide repeat protein [Mucilaginibacter sp. 14171R-50]|uniref:tetratricopeptide repeat protein n=1 Tax=Mucilaginibacter sp. 14171R-50 TaxID=2703789 RepID=UPI00138B95CA|nr:tetratricopeptide repeat protein [Mucilaginibacter sp. 14171R-50]QHS56286.1 tetratricopeptide repeat protein [Mucilaginibacter sp. 14171R-50]